MPRLTTAEAVLETLLEHGIDTLFALPGVHNDPLFDAAHKASERMRVIHPRHEQTAAYMALGAALVTGKPQAFAVVPGPGILNASAALLLAYGMNAPVVALVGQIPSFAIDHGHGHLHEIHDQIGLLRHITKHARRIRSPQEASARVARAIEEALSGRQGPVALECAIDTWGLAAEVTLSPPIGITPPRADPRAIQAAADLLCKAERPLIVVGGGALDAGPCVQRVAELLQRPGVVVPPGQGDHSDRTIRLRCPSPRATPCGRPPMRCSPSARGSIGSRATGAWTSTCRSSGWISTRTRSTACAVPPSAYSATPPPRCSRWRKNSRRAATSGCRTPTFPP